MTWWSWLDWIWVESPIDSSRCAHSSHSGHRPETVHAIFEDNPLIVTFAGSFRLHAVCADWAFFSAFYASFSTCCTFKKRDVKTYISICRWVCSLSDIE